MFEWCLTRIYLRRFYPSLCFVQQFGPRVILGTFQCFTSTSTVVFCFHILMYYNKSSKLNLLKQQLSLRIYYYSLCGIADAKDVNGFWVNLFQTQNSKNILSIIVSVFCMLYLHCSHCTLSIGTELCLLKQNIYSILFSNDLTNCKIMAHQNAASIKLWLKNPYLLSFRCKVQIHI